MKDFCYVEGLRYSLKLNGNSGTVYHNTSARITLSDGIFQCVNVNIGLPNINDFCYIGELRYGLKMNGDLGTFLLEHKCLNHCTK